MNEYFYNFSLKKPSLLATPINPHLLSKSGKDKNRDQDPYLLKKNIITIKTFHLLSSNSIPGKNKMFNVKHTIKQLI